MSSVRHSGTVADWRTLGTVGNPLLLHIYRYLLRCNNMWVFGWTQSSRYPAKRCRGVLQTSQNAQRPIKQASVPLSILHPVSTRMRPQPHCSRPTFLICFVRPHTVQKTECVVVASPLQLPVETLGLVLDSVSRPDALSVILTSSYR